VLPLAWLAIVGEVVAAVEGAVSVEPATVGASAQEDRTLAASASWRGALADHDLALAEPGTHAALATTLLLLVGHQMCPPPSHTAKCEPITTSTTMRQIRISLRVIQSATFRVARVPSLRAFRFTTALGPRKIALNVPINRRMA
jgi:hypothetical protein